MSANPLAAVIVLAAGEGTRMKSKALPKVLHPICGRSLLGHVVTAAQELTPQQLVVVIGHLKEQVAEHLGADHPQARTVVQDEQNGTGHAARIALEALAADGITLDGTVLVTYGDAPLLTAGTMRELVHQHTVEGNGVTVLTAEVPDPTGYGRILRDPRHGTVTAIVEHKDADAAQLAITEINSGVYAFDGKLLADALARIGTDNVQGEEYLTDTLEILRGAYHRVGAMVAADHRDILGINDRVQLAEAHAAAQRPAADGRDAGRRHRGRPGHHLDRRAGGLRAGRRAAARHPAARGHPPGRGLPGGPEQHPDRHRGRGLLPR